MSELVKPFINVDNKDIENFLKNTNLYKNKIAFLGTSGQIVTQNNIYGINVEDFNSLKDKVGNEEVFHYATEEDISNGKATNIGDKIIDTAASGLYKELNDINSALENILGI